MQPSIRSRVRVPIFEGKSVAEVITFRDLSDGREHIALALGPVEEANTPTVRLHSECLTGDVFGSARCDCGPQLSESMKRIEEVGGYLLYLRQEGRGIGLYNKIDAYLLQDSGLDTYEANRTLGFADDLRDFKCAAEMLKALGVHRVNLLSNNPRKEHQLIEYGITVVGTSATQFYENPNNALYLKAKRISGGHRFPERISRAVEV